MPFSIERGSPALGWMDTGSPLGTMARATANSSGSQPLATATHVIGNAGDRDALIEQIDVLWTALNDHATGHSTEQ